MKVELKINFDTLLAVSSLVNKIYELPATFDERTNVYFSIGCDVADRFDSKTKGQLKKQNLFDHKKLHKITLKFHEAWALQAILMDLISTVTSPYQKGLIQKVINIIDQKIA